MAFLRCAVAVLITCLLVASCSSSSSKTVGNRGQQLLNAACGSQFGNGAVAVVMKGASGPASAVCVTPAPGGALPTVTLNGHATMAQGRAVCPAGQQLFDRGGGDNWCATVSPAGAKVDGGLDIQAECSDERPGSKYINDGTSPLDSKCEVTA